MLRQLNVRLLEIVLTMTYPSDMYINDEDLRKQIHKLLLTRTRNQIVEDIKLLGYKMHHFQVNNFLKGKDVTLSTLHKLDNYVSREVYLNGLEPL
jgi:hypothetical protein